MRKSDLVRKGIHFTTKQWSKVEIIAEDMGINNSEYIRRIVDEHMERLTEKALKLIEKVK